MGKIHSLVGWSRQSITTPTLATEALRNRDFASRRIVEGKPYVWPEQIAEYAAENLISPYGTFQGTFLPGGAKGDFAQELAAQLADIRNPTDRQLRGGCAAKRNSNLADSVSSQEHNRESKGRGG
jgi:hypothetical protein